MFADSAKKVLTALAVFAGLWLGVKYLLPLALPFLLGAALAVTAEPLVRKLSTRLPRGVASGVGVGATLAGVSVLGALAGAFLFREAGNLAAAVPDLTVTARQGIDLLQNFLVGLAEKAPEGIQPVLQRSVSEFFKDGTVLLQQVTQRLPGAVGATIGWLGDSLLGIGTGILAAFLISARLPRLRALLKKSPVAELYEKYQPALRRVRVSLGGWLKAQLKLSAVTWVIVTVGFLLLQIPYGPAWAALVVLVDAVPILGTGTVLVPWAVICILKKESLRAIGLLCTYGAALMTRTVLEPRLVGHHLGLDPLVTLGALYVGYRLWGIPGLLLTPIIASAAKSLTETKA